MMLTSDTKEQVPTSVLSAERCHLGEGPTYDATTDTAWWFDILEGRLFEARLGSGRISIHHLGRMASALARIDAERQLIVTEDGLYIRSIIDGRMTLYCPLEADNPSNRSNDARVHPAGTFWIGTMIQDAPVAGTPLSVDFLARMARDIANISYFKIEVPMAAAKLRDLIAVGGGSIVGPWDGEEAITLMADLDAGATGAMTGGGYPDGIRQIMDPYFAGRRDEAAAAYARWLPLINYENRQCGLQACKILMKEGGVIGSDAVRHPLQKVHPATRAGLIDIARSLDPVVLRWGR